MKLNTKYEIRNTRYDKGFTLSVAKGFTLIEILIFTSIVSVFFITAAAVSAFSLSIMRTNENRIYATHYAEEVSEWLLNEKDASDWPTFSGRVGAWCMNTLAWTSGSCPISGAGSYALGAEYSRQFNRDVVLTAVGDGTISSSITVSWRDTNNNLMSVPINTIYAQTE